MSGALLVKNPEDACTVENGRCSEHLLLLRAPGRDTSVPVSTGAFAESTPVCVSVVSVRRNVQVRVCVSVLEAVLRFSTPPRPLPGGCWWESRVCGCWGGGATGFSVSPASLASLGTAMPPAHPVSLCKAALYLSLCFLVLHAKRRSDALLRNTQVAFNAADHFKWRGHFVE